MKVYLDTNYQSSFQAKVSQRFISSMRGFVNNSENRLQNNYKLTQKLEEYAKFGYDNYTIEMHQNCGALGFNYKLVAIKDGDTSGKGVILTKKRYTSYRQIFNRFMNLSRFDFDNIMKQGLK